MAEKKKPARKKAVAKKVTAKTKQVETVKNDSYTELEIYCIWLNEYYTSLLNAGFKHDVALTLLMDKDSYPSWVQYKAPTQEELGKYLDEDDDDLWDS